MMTAETNTLKRSEIRQIFKRNHGAQAEVAKGLGVSHVTIVTWLKGKTSSRRVSEAMNAKALELLGLESERRV